MKICNPGQKIALGLTYGISYSKPSKKIHADIGGLKDLNSIEDVGKNLGNIGLLAAHVLLAVKRLLKIKASSLEYVGELHKIFKENMYPKKLLMSQTRPKIKKGDFVVAYGDIAEVIKIVKSDYGFKSFWVSYIDVSPIPSIRKECFPGKYVRLIFKREKVARQVKEEIKKASPNEKINYKAVANALRKTVVHLWQNLGLKEHVLGRPDLMQKKLEMALKKRKEGNASPNP